jgi:hypothetical protein
MWGRSVTCRSTEPKARHDGEHLVRRGNRADNFQDHGSQRQ